VFGQDLLPMPAVQFIVEAVDDILKQDFAIPHGLADDSNRVQILDPALGTGTFLAETVRKIYEHFQNQQGMWQSYVSNHLIPRLNGFEILMAPYAMAHLKLEMSLRQSGYRHSTNERLRIYLTNSLEEAYDKTEFLMTEWLSDEANEASRIKQEVPVMVVMGNPPYSGESQNSGEWMDRLLNDYKKEPTGEKLQERNSKWINDDYVKFIRLGQEFVKKNGEGVLAFINNHSFLDNPTFRGMRWELLKAFDKIFILDLHGNSKKKEVAPDGGKDENVFDIQQGVSINIFVKTGRKKTDSSATVFHCDLYGKRAEKYAILRKKRLQSVKWIKLKPTAPQYFFVAKDFSQQKEYEQGFSVKELFRVNSVGILSMGDSFAFSDSKVEIWKRLELLLDKDYTAIQLNSDYSFGKNYAEFILQAKTKLKLDSNALIEIDYRPFEKKWTYFDNKVLWRTRTNVMQHFLKGENVGLVTCRQGATASWELVYVTKKMVDDSFVSNRTKERGYVFPLYLYPPADELMDDVERKPNLNETIVNEMSQRLGLRYTKEKTKNTFAPIDILDYIYAVLHSPTYRERYKEFLKIDFPRVPYPRDAKKFWKLVKLGEKLRRLHLMEEVAPQSGVANFPIAGTNEVESLRYIDGKVYISDTQYFDHIPSNVWKFYIGGYQPAQKWLKDRKGRTLSFDEIQHYQKIVFVLQETIKTMGAIDALLTE
jgi:predicted helicase